jgi:hypothetical protein
MVELTMLFRFTLFHISTLIVVALTLLLLVARWRKRLRLNWPLAYYLLAVAYAAGFRYSLYLPVVFAGALCAVVLRFVHLRGAPLTVVRVLEMLVLVYVLARCVGLFLGWRDIF